MAHQKDLDQDTSVRRQGKCVSQMRDAITGDGTLNVHIRRLREKIEEDPNEPRFIKTIWGTGYVFETCHR